MIESMSFFALKEGGLSAARKSFEVIKELFECLKKQYCSNIFANNRHLNGIHSKAKQIFVCQFGFISILLCRQQFQLLLCYILYCLVTKLYPSLTEMAIEHEFSSDFSLWFIRSYLFCFFSQSK